MEDPNPVSGPGPRLKGEQVNKEGGPGGPWGPASLQEAAKVRLRLCPPSLSPQVLCLLGQFWGVAGHHGNDVAQKRERILFIELCVFTARLFRTKYFGTCLLGPRALFPAVGARQRGSLSVNRTLGRVFPFPAQHGRKQPGGLHAVPTHRIVRCAQHRARSSLQFPAQAGRALHREGALPSRKKVAVF